MAKKEISLKRFRSDERGNVAVIFALALIPAATLAGGAIDYGRVLSERTRLQYAADSATLAAARIADTSANDRVTMARQVFAAHVANTSLSSVVPTVDVAGDRVHMLAQASIRTPFLSLVKIPTLDAIIDSTSEGTPQNNTAIANGKVCLLALDPNSTDGIHLQGGNIVNYINCWAHTNSTMGTAINANGNNSLAVGKGHCAVGGWTQTHATFSNPLPTAGCATVQDPFATGSVYGPSYTPNFTPPTKAYTCKSSNLNLKKGTFTLDPGRYCGGITIMAQATVTFNPGVYYIDNGIFDIQSGANVSGSNLLFYLEGAASRMQVIGGGNINITGRTSASSYSGFLAIAHPNANPMGESNIQGGGTFKMEGVLYLPKQRIEVSGNGDVNNVSLNVFGMVAKDFYFRGNGVFNAKKHSGAGNIPDIMPSMPAQSTLNKTVLKE